MSDLNGTEANQSGLSANTEHTLQQQPVIPTKEMAADIEQSNGHSLQDKTEPEALPLDDKENGSLAADEKPSEAAAHEPITDKMDTTEDSKDSDLSAKQPTAEASAGDKRVRDEDDVEHKPSDTVQESSEVAATPATAAGTTTATSTEEPITKEVKKLKTDAEVDEPAAPSADTTAPTTEAATEDVTETTTATEETTPKKRSAGRPKKDETKIPSVTDEVKEAVETVARRTRSSRGSV